FQSLKLPTVAEVQAMLRPDEVLVEYYTIGDRFQAFIISRDSFDFVRDFTTTGVVRSSLKGLTFQLSKFHLQPAYVQNHAAQLLRATDHHLRELHRQLIEPIQDKIQKRSMVVVPHQLLHYVPFHALYDGTNYLIDSHDIAYAPSVSVLKICREKKIQKT